MEQQKIITISMEEYKELLIIKGKYEELKSYTMPDIYPHKITWRGDSEPLGYKVTCCEEDSGV